MGSGITSDQFPPEPERLLLVLLVLDRPSSNSDTITLAGIYPVLQSGPSHTPVPWNRSIKRKIVDLCLIINLVLYLTDII